MRLYEVFYITFFVVESFLDVSLFDFYGKVCKEIRKSIYDFILGIRELWVRRVIICLKYGFD